MDWDEALLTPGGMRPQQPAAYYRQRATRARQMAEEVTTSAIRARLLEEATSLRRELQVARQAPSR